MSKQRYPVELDGRKYPSRQVLRNAFRLEARAEMNKQYGGEPHHTRRLMAFALGNRRYRLVMELPPVKGETT